MPDLDLQFVRAQFPAFSESSLRGVAFFDNAAGSYACGQVIDALQGYYVRTKVQPHNPLAASREAGEAMDRARDRLAAWLNVASDEVSIGPSTSQNTFNVAQALRPQLGPGDEVIVTNQDHEANIGAWRRLEAAGATVREWRVDPETAELATNDLADLLSDRTRVVAFTHASNIVGSINPARQWCDMVRDAGALSIVDGVSYAPHGLPDVGELGADIYLLSLYKVYGPHQGVMVMRQAVNDALPNQGHFFNAAKRTARFTPAGPDHAQIAAVNGVMDYFEAVHDHHFGDTGHEGSCTAAVHDLMRAAEMERVGPLLDFLSSHPKVRLIGRTSPANRAPTVSFTCADQSPTAIAERLAEHDIGISSSHCYAYRLIEALGHEPEEGVARLSLVHYTSADEVSRLIDALDEIL